MRAMPALIQCLLSSSRPRPAVVRHMSRLIDSMPPNVAKVTFSRSSGPGGQNVNKVSTKAELRLDVEAAVSSGWLKADAAERLKAQNKVTNSRELILVSQLHRTQRQNKDDCFQKLGSILEAAKVPPKERHQHVGISEVSKHKRKEFKRIRSTVKAGRKPVRDY